MTIKKNDELFTYADYLTWPDEERWELIEGVPFDMTPAPSRYHQEIFGNLFVEIKNFLEGKKCKIYAAPFDVRLPEGEQEDKETLTVVQPDISVICDREKLDEKGCVGAPDFIVEIVSPSTVKKDMKNKLLLYEKHGVPEYWVVQPGEHALLVYKLDENGRYGRADVYTKEDEIELILNENTLVINLETVFEE